MRLIALKQARQRWLAFSPSQQFKRSCHLCNTSQMWLFFSLLGKGALELCVSTSEFSCLKAHWKIHMALSMSWFCSFVCRRSVGNAKDGATVLNSVGPQQLISGSCGLVSICPPLPKMVAGVVQCGAGHGNWEEKSRIDGVQQPCGPSVSMPSEHCQLAVGQNHWCHVGVGAPPMLVYFSGWIGMFTGATEFWLLTQANCSFSLPSGSSYPNSHGLQDAVEHSIGF